MPKNKDLKRRIRARMEKTGESYTAARAQLLRTQPSKPPASPTDLAERAGMSDAAVRRATARDWRQWVELLDAVDAASMPHAEIARHLQTEHAIDGWWAQTVTVGYERIRGLRAKGQRRGGGFDVNKSKTIAVPIATLYAAFASRRQRARWLHDADPTVRTSRRNRSVRLLWDDDTRVDVYFWEKGEAKSQVQLQHRGLPSAERAAEVRSEWAARLAALAEALLRPRR